MEWYDAIIIGAGPAGGQCARDLARKGRRVLLVERAKNFWENNYSSGGAPLEVMQDFELPSSIVGSYWNQLNIFSTQERVTWSSPLPFGPVIDFDKLRSFLAEETIRHGGHFLLNCHYQSHTVSSEAIQVRLRDQKAGQDLQLQTKVLIDATGSERRVLSSKNYDKSRAMAVTGIEYHVQVEPTVYEQFNCSLNFFLGHYWMPQGYGWIFSMAPHQLKVGVIRYFQNKTYVPHEPSYRPYLERLLKLCGDAKHVQLVDKHGKTIHYTLGQKDTRYRGPVLAIGDAISTINPLGCEGIRHALVSGRKAAHEVDRFLKREVSTFKQYDHAMTKYFGHKWSFSEILMKSLFAGKSDRLIDRMVRYFACMNHREIIDVIFHYRFHRTLKSYFLYFISRFRDLFH